MKKAQNNVGKKSGSKTPSPSNKGKTGGLRKASGTNQGAMDKPTTTNRFPNGLA